MDFHTIAPKKFLFLQNQLTIFDIEIVQKVGLSGIMSRIKTNEFVAKEYVTHLVSERDVMVWKEVFDAFDCDEDGSLAPRDLLKAISKYNGYHPKRNEFYQILGLYDKDGNGTIDFQEFLNMVNQKPYEKDTVEDYKRVFNEIDQEYKGYLDEEDLRNLAAELKEDLSEQQIRQIMRKLDPKKEGKITLEAFMNFNRQKIF